MIFSALLLAACGPDDYDSAHPYVDDTNDTHDTEDIDTSDTSDTTDTSGGDGLVGTWLSAGSDLSDLFAGDPFNFTHITATFHSNGTYDVDILDADAQTATLMGTYTTDESTSPATIAQHQSDPSEAIASGIFDVSGDTLRFEVVQTSPDYGFVPPTPSGGFGSTSGPNMTAGINTQTYRRQ
jgi:hypothetical protein